MPHPLLGHLMTGVVALAPALFIIRLTPNALVRRKLRLSLLLLGAYLLVHLVLMVRPLIVPAAFEGELHAFEQLALAAALINLVVIAAINPLRADRIPDAFPSIVQDAIVIALLAAAAAAVFGDRFLATSAVGAVVVGFALQDTLGNAFAGLALQSEKPFRVGAWIRVGEFEGRVAEVTWRATKLRTKAGNFVVVPNNIVAKEAITNYSEPIAPTRLDVEVGASYLSTPGDVKRAILEAVANVPRVLETPPPTALLLAFDASAINYRVQFWIENYQFDDVARDEVRTAIFYAFSRHNIEIPWPIEVGYQREWPEPDAAAKQRQRETILSGVDLFSGLTEEQRCEIAAATSARLFGHGEAIVRQGAPGHSMFVVCSGAVAVLLGSERCLVATIPEGGYFGEMSLLTGDPRTATVEAVGDTMVLELDAAIFRRLAAADPEAVERVGAAAITRRIELDQAREVARMSSTVQAPETMLGRMKRFLGIG